MVSIFSEYFVKGERNLKKLVKSSFQFNPWFRFEVMFSDVNLILDTTTGDSSENL